MDNQNELGELRKTKLNPDDVIILRLKRPSDQHTIEQYRDELSKVFPDNKVVVFGSGVEMEIAEAAE